MKNGLPNNIHTTNTNCVNYTLLYYPQDFSLFWEPQMWTRLFEATLQSTTVPLLTWIPLVGFQRRTWSVSYCMQGKSKGWLFIIFNALIKVIKIAIQKLYAYTICNRFNLAEVSGIVEAPPTAELQPLASNQTDEEDMGMTYEELSYFGNLRKPLCCGPFSMVARLLHLWRDRHEPAEIARKVKHFYTSYAANRLVSKLE